MNNRRWREYAYLTGAEEVANRQANKVMTGSEEDSLW